MLGHPYVHCVSVVPEHPDDEIYAPPKIHREHDEHVHVVPDGVEYCPVGQHTPVAVVIVAVVPDTLETFAGILFVPSEYVNGVASPIAGDTVGHGAVPTVNDTVADADVSELHDHVGVVVVYANAVPPAVTQFVSVH
jgi:hypothetical protein